MANERLYQFPLKTSPVPADILYVGDSANSFNEVRSTIAEIIAAYPNLASLGALTLTANTYAYMNNSAVLTAGSISAFGVSLIAAANAGAAQTILGLAIGTNVQAYSAALTSIAGLTTTAHNLLYTTANDTYDVIAPANNSTLVTDNTGVPSLSQTLPSAVQGNITALGTQGSALNMGSHQINNVTNPTLPQDAATKAYADAIASGITVQGACRLATTGALTVTYANGTAGVGATITNAGAQAALTLDGIPAVVGDRTLIKNQASSLQNGIYTVTDIGSGSTDWIQTRATDYDLPSQINPGDLVVITAGNTLTKSSWLQTDTVTAIGTDPIAFTQFSASLPISVPNGGTGLTSTTINQLLYSSSNNVIAGLATANSAYLVTNSSGVPSWNTNLPVINATSQLFATPGAFTYTPNAKMVFCIIELQGGGGGSGGTTGTAGQAAASGAGAGGAYIRFLTTKALVGASAPGNVGAVGAAGSSGNNAGGAGGNSSITIGGGTIWSAGGGGGGGGNTSSAILQGSGSLGAIGLASLGTNGTQIITRPGGYPGNGYTVASAGVINNLVPMGGDAFYDSVSFRNSASGAPASGWGGGSSGGINTSGANSVGAAGSQGVVIITEFLSA